MPGTLLMVSAQLTALGSAAQASTESAALDHPNKECMQQDPISTEDNYIFQQSSCVMYASMCYVSRGPYGVPC